MATEFVHLKPKPGAEAELMELRPKVISEHLARYPAITAELYELEDGTWMDVWVWPNREQAEEALADETLSPAFNKWQTLVDLYSIKWGESRG